MAHFALLTWTAEPPQQLRQSAPRNPSESPRSCGCRRIRYAPVEDPHPLGAVAPSIRPVSRSQGFALYNGAKLSLEIMTPPTSSAMLITNASPQSSVPVGGCTTFPSAMAAST